MDKPRVNTTVAHKLARMVYFMLTRGEAFDAEGLQRYESQHRLLRPNLRCCRHLNGSMRGA